MDSSPCSAGKTPEEQNRFQRVLLGAEAKKGGGADPYHPGQSHVGHDGEEDDHAGGDEVAKSAVLQVGATFRDRSING